MNKVHLFNLYNRAYYDKICRYDATHCPGRIQTVNDRVVKTSLHTHAPDARNYPVHSVVAEMRQEAATAKSSKEIIANACSKVKGVVIYVKAALPKISNIRRLKQKRNIAPVTPRLVRELIIDAIFTVTANNENFLLFDNGATDRRIIVFATDANIRFLKECGEWYLDGTFRICPPLFSQIYTIHGRYILNFRLCFPKVDWMAYF